LSLFFINSYFTVSLQAQESLTFPNWKALHQLNPRSYRSDNHNAWVNLYVNKKAKKAYKEVKARFPIGSLVLKSLFVDYNQTQFKKLAIMVKMQKGYDPVNNDWWYGLYDESGMIAEREGKMFDCIDCHEVVRETDFMFSEDVMSDFKNNRYMHPNDL
jgi:hypothetical protein